MKIDITQPVTQLPGVGAARAALLEKIGVRTINDLFWLRPHRYLDFSRIAQPNELKPGDNATLAGTIRAVGARRIKRRGVLFCEASLQCANGNIVLVWFLPGKWATHPPVKEGESIIVAGTVTEGPRGLQLVHPLLERAEAQFTGTIVPVYPLTQGLQQPFLRRCAHTALSALGSVTDSVPNQLLRKRQLPSLPEALQWMHAPSRMSDVEGARVRMAYQEALVMALAIAWRRRALQNSPNKRCRPDSPSLRTWLSQLPYELTAGQKAAIGDISLDMGRSQAMQRLIHGDVGSGKTTVAMFAIAKAVENGMQAALLTPTRILAEQHFQRWNSMFAGTKVKPALLLGGQSATQITTEVAQSTINLVIGTHAILDLPFANLGLVVVDEQHRFGVEQRAFLTQRFHTHCLYLSATPIPRSMSLALWGDVDISTVPGKPAGRSPVDTRWVIPSQRAEVYKFVKRAVAAGRQAYIVYPRIDTEEESDSPDTIIEKDNSYPSSATAAFDYLSKGPLSGLKLALLHGRIPVANQEKVMSAFAHGEIDVLVCTTVIEVGVDVSNATVMVVEQADMFGLAQLHQLRGRVGRGEEQSYCLLVADPRTPEGRERIQVLRSTDDGFVLAEEDLRLRGPGEVLGTKQSGFGELEYAQLPHDLPLLQAAQEDACFLLQHDPELNKSEHQALKADLHARFPSVSPIAG